MLESSMTLAIQGSAKYDQHAKTIPIGTSFQVFIYTDGRWYPGVVKDVNGMTFSIIPGLRS